MNIEALYQEAKTALVAKEYDHAADLLRQILLQDHDYKDASRLLAQTIRLKRRRWYNDPRVWGVAGLFIISVIIYWVRPIFSTQIPTHTAESLADASPVVVFSPTPTSLLLKWKRIVLGQQFPIDVVVSIVTDYKDKDIIYAGMKNAGVYKTIDGGISWFPVLENLGSSKIDSIAIDPNDSQIVYAGSEGGIFKSIDGGNIWTWLSEAGAYSYEPGMVTSDPNRSNHVFILNWLTYRESFDGGEHWFPDFPSNPDTVCPRVLTPVFIDPSNRNRLIVAGRDSTESCPMGLYQSLDAGKTWEILGFKDEYINQLAFGLDYQGTYSIFIILDDSLSISFDNGISWEVQNLPADNSIIAVNPNNLSEAYLYSKNNNAIYSTVDGGHNWSGRKNNTPFPVLNTLHLDELDGFPRLIAGHTGLSISLDEGTTWSEMNNGLGARRLELKIDPVESSIFYVAAYASDSGEECTLYRSDDRGQNWVTILKSDSSSYCGPVFDGDRNLYAIQNGQLIKSFDAGATWRSLNQPEQSIESVSVDPNNPDNIYIIKNFPYIMYYSADGGKTWNISDGFSPDDMLLDGQLFFSSNENVVYSTSMWWKFRSENKGITWQACPSIHSSNNSDTEMIVDPGNDQRVILASVGYGILISNDGCRTWEQSNTGFDSLNVNSVALDPNSITTYYAGAAGGAYVSYDSGLSWNKINEGLLGVPVVYSIAIDKDSNVFAATPYGIFKLESK